MSSCTVKINYINVCYTQYHSFVGSMPHSWRCDRYYYDTSASLWASVVLLRAESAFWWKVCFNWISLLNDYGISWIGFSIFLDLELNLLNAQCKMQESKFMDNMCSVTISHLMTYNDVIKMKSVLCQDVCVSFSEIITAPTSCQITN